MHEPATPAQPGAVTEDLVFAVTKRTGVPFGVVSSVLFAAHEHRMESLAES